MSINQTNIAHATHSQPAIPPSPYRAVRAGNRGRQQHAAARQSRARARGAQLRPVGMEDSFDAFGGDFGDDFGAEFGGTGASQTQEPAPAAAEAGTEAVLGGEARAPSPSLTSAPSTLLPVAAAHSGDREHDESWPYVGERGLFTVPYSVEDSAKCGWLLMEETPGLWRRRWCMLQAPRGYLSIHEFDASGSAATAVIPTSMCRVRKVKQPQAQPVGEAVGDIPEGQPPENPENTEIQETLEMARTAMATLQAPQAAYGDAAQAEPEPEPELTEPEPESQPETMKDRVSSQLSALLQQANDMDDKYGLTGNLSKVAGPKFTAGMALLEQGREMLSASQAASPSPRPAGPAGEAEGAGERGGGPSTAADGGAAGQQQPTSLVERLLGLAGPIQVRQPLRPFWPAVLTEIYLCNPCSCQEISRRNGRGQAGLAARAASSGLGEQFASSSPSAEGELSWQEKAETVRSALLLQASALEQKYRVAQNLQSLGGKAEVGFNTALKDLESKFGQLDEKHGLADKMSSAKKKVVATGAEIDSKYGLTLLAESARVQAMEAAGYLVSAPFPSFARPVLTAIFLCHACFCQEILRAKTARQDSAGEDSGSEVSLNAAGGDDPLRHKWAFRIDISNDTLPLVVGSRAPFFVMDPGTESGQLAWFEAITGAGDAAAAGQSGSSTPVAPDEAAGSSHAWLPFNRQPRTQAEAVRRETQHRSIDLISIPDAQDIEKWVAKKAAKSLGQRIITRRVPTAALDEAVLQGKQRMGAASVSSATGSGVASAAKADSPGMITKLKESVKGSKDAAASGTAATGTSKAMGASPKVDATGQSGAVEPKAASTGVRDAALLGALVGGATSAVEGYNTSQTDAQELVRVADVVSTLSLGHMQRLICDRTGRSALAMPAAERVQAVLEACEIDVESITDSTRLTIAKATLLGAASSTAPAAVAAVATKQALLRGAGSKLAGAAGSIAMAAFDIGKDAKKLSASQINLAEFKKKAGGHVTSSTAGTAGALQGASLGGVVGPVGSFVGAVLGGLGASLGAGMAYEIATEEDEEMGAEILASRRAAAAAKCSCAEVVGMDEAPETREPLRTLLQFFSTDELWRYLSDRAVLTRMDGEVLHATELRQAALELLRSDGCLCLDEAEISSFPHAQLCRLLLDAGKVTLQELGTLDINELRVRVFDAYGPVNADQTPFSSLIAPSGDVAGVYNVVMASSDLAQPVPVTGVKAPLQWLDSFDASSDSADKLRGSILICSHDTTLTYAQTVANAAKFAPSAIMVVDVGSQAESRRMLQPPVPIPVVMVTADVGAALTAMLTESEPGHTRVKLDFGTAMFVSKTKATEPEPETEVQPTTEEQVGSAPVANAEGGAEAQSSAAITGPEAEPESEPDLQGPAVEWVEFAQVPVDRALASADGSTEKNLADQANEMLYMATKSATSFLSRKFKRVTDAQDPLTNPASPDFGSCPLLVSASAPLGGAVPADEDPAIANNVLLLPSSLLVEGATTWHVLYCALKAGAAGVIFVADAESEAVALQPAVAALPCVSITESTAQALETVVGIQAEPDDMFAPIPSAEGEDSTSGVLTAGLGLWIGDCVRFRSVAVGQEHCLALTTHGSVFAWGSARQGRLGLGSAVTAAQTQPTNVRGKLGGVPVSTVHCGHNFSYAVTAPGTLYSWGCNDSPGFLGLGDTVHRWEPCEVVRPCTSLSKYDIYPQEYMHIMDRPTPALGGISASFLCTSLCYVLPEILVFVLMRRTT
jgi:hypothetical protein